MPLATLAQSADVFAGCSNEPSIVWAIMFEAKKTNRIRDLEFLAQFMSGKVLDIGCRRDLVVPHAQPFDLRHGDANYIARYLPAESFDCVHSSHCLEHMHSPPESLPEWWSLLKPGGHMVLTVPEENLYEQGRWPSVFNTDHKWTFRKGGATSWSPVSLDVIELVEKLPKCEVIEITVQDHGYDYSLCDEPKPVSPITRWISDKRKWVTQKMLEVGVPFALAVERLFARIERRFGIPIDQTRLGALAQIHVILRKRA